MDSLQAPPPTLNSMADQSDYSIPNRSISNSPVHSCSQIAKCDSNFPEPQAQCKGSGKEASMDFTTSGISQKILTRISGSTLSENLNYSLQNYPSVTDTLSPITSPTPTMEADSSVMSPSENILCVGRRVLAAWDRFRYHNGVILRIDDEGIQVAFDMGDLKTYPLDCKDKIVIDRKALAHELVKDTPVLVRLPRRKALYKGRVHSSGTIRGYCILFDDTRRDRVWKRTKSLRVVTDYVVVKGSSKLDRDTTVDTSCTNEETIDSSLFSVTSKDRSTLDLPSQSILQDEVPGDIQCVPKQPKIFHSGFPTMVHYDGQSTVLRFPESTTDDQRIASAIQTHEELPVQQSSHLYSPVSASFQPSKVKSQRRLQSNMAGSRPNLIGFQSHVFGSRSDLGESSVIDTQSNLTSFQSKVPDSRSNLTGFQFNDPGSRFNITSFQSGFPGSRSNLTSFQSNVADPRSDLTSFQSNIPGSRSHLTSYHSTIGSQSNQADFQSKFTQDIFNYFPRSRHVSSGMQRRNVDFSGRNIHSPIIYTGQHNQCLIPSYIGRKTANRNALYYSQPSHSITPSPFTVAERDYHVFVPIHRTEKQLGCGDTSETFSHGTEETRRVHRPICSSMVSNQGRESVLSEYSSDFWPSSGTTDEKSSCSFQDYVSQEVCTANESSHLSNSSGIAEFNQNMTSTTKENAIHTTIKQEPTSPSSFIDSSQINTLSNLPLPSPDDTQCYRRLDSPEDVSPEEYFHGVLSTCSTPRPTCVMEPEQMMEDQYAMSTTDRMGPTYTIPPACQAAPAYSALPAHLTPTADPTTHTYSIQPDNLTQPAYSIPYGYPTQPAYPTQPTRLTTPAHPTQPANLSTPAYLTTPGLPACSRIPIYSIGRMEPNSYMPFITEVECSAQLESSSQTKKSLSNSQEYEPEWLYGINSVKPTTVIHYPPTGESYTLQTSQVSGKNTKYNRRCSPEANVQHKEFCTSENVSSAFGSQPSDSSHLVKFPLTREERKRKILSAFGFNNFERSSSSCKTRRVEEEETVRPNAESKETKQIKGVQYSSYGESSSTTGENSSGCMVSSNLDQVCALSPSVVKAATILSNSCLQRWKTFSNLKSSVKRSLTPSFDETSATKYKKRYDSCNTNRLRENKRSVRDEIGKGENGNGVGTSGSTFQKGTKTIDQAKKDKNDTPSFPLYDEVTTYNVSSTHKTVAIQLRSKDTKPLRRPRICIQRQSTASQTQQANPSDTILLDENKKGKKIHSFYKTAIEMSPSIESTDVEKIQDEESNDNKSILIGESEGTEGLPLVAREVEVRTTSSVSVNTQQFNNQFTLTLSVEDENEEEGSPSVAHLRDVSKPSSGSLNTRESKQSTIIAIVETEGKEEGSPLVAGVVEVCTTSSESVNTQQKISEDISVATSKNIVENNTKLPLLSDTNGFRHSAQEFVTADANVFRTAQESTASFGLVQSKLKSVESQSNDSSTVKESFLMGACVNDSENASTEGDFGDINLRCDEVINETDIDQPNTNTSPKAKKSKEEMTVHLQITSQQVEVKFVDEATILLYSETPPLRFLTCL